MRKRIIISIIISFVFCSGLVSAGENDFPPRGMKIEKVGDLQILVPEGAKVERTGKNGLIHVEATEDYVARKLLDMEDRLEEMEKHQQELKEAIDKLKSMINNLEDRLVSTESSNE